MSNLAETGIAGLNDVLRGGWVRDRMYLVQGEPGVGKTTLAFQFLLDGVTRGESCLYVTLAETRDEVVGVASAHGWDLTGLHIFELSAIEQTLTKHDNTLFDPADIDLQEVTEALLAEVDRVKPSRVVFDSLSEVRLLAQDPLRYRRQILALKTYFSTRKATVLLLDDQGDAKGDEQVRSLVHGVLALEKLALEYGTERRRMHVAKLRGVPFRGGYHDYVINKGGIAVYPRLVAAEHRVERPKSVLASGVGGLDALAGGGVDYGTATLIVGPAGAGKSTLALHYALATARNGGKAVFYAFEESRSTLMARAEALGMKLRELVDAGRVIIQQVDPAEVSPGQFAHMVRAAIDDGVDVLIIDSLNGYISAMPEESFLTLHMHELLSYASQKGVATFLIMAQHGLMGSGMAAPVDVSYIADTVLLLRFFEVAGEIKKAVSVLKKRAGAHETAIRELRFGPGGAVVGDQLKSFHGVLTGVPRFVGPTNQMMTPPADE